jgi:hypothetical protein
MTHGQGYCILRVECELERIKKMPESTGAVLNERRYYHKHTRGGIAINGEMKDQINGSTSHSAHVNRRPLRTVPIPNHAPTHFSDCKLSQGDRRVPAQ